MKLSRQRPNPRSIKLHRTYSVEEAARALGVHKNSVRGWRQRGLKPIDDSRPVLFLGSDLRAFLEQRNASRKRPCRPGTLYCFRCREARAPALGMVDWTSTKARTGNLTALCGTCGTEMHRRARRDALAVVMPGLQVQISEGPSRLNGEPIPSLNCDMAKKD
ncbi:helix-turn-helix domain-containing protein [Devosia rhodophyticola]|uniref:Helix-turn-helix domain-containing protein n=1 Tax=Devosia rhodophyticola TaxID=3026423 RepID=A0ABY7Z016_9HYPH|nr:helix-turn-helix domain-containing protein [Devosia rhodophyticola]WDR06673.1 helix-turn-helix domain-containing protein [Devosia rhodophyticola]